MKYIIGLIKILFHALQWQKVILFIRISYINYQLLYKNYRVIKFSYYIGICSKKQTNALIFNGFNITINVILIINIEQSSN